ncbi:hypothetical protein VNO78_30731 [Psophocarpus tetragonolobus]|uniref:Uncharacterized protein n=1 Tax=Psophocarpus tetragonolobus TaxID=3891 RepID=A0AAN9RX60_PSOTE
MSRKDMRKLDEIVRTSIDGWEFDIRVKEVEEVNEGKNSRVTTSYGSENGYCQEYDDVDESAEAESRLAELKRKMLRDGEWKEGDVEEGGSAEWVDGEGESDGGNGEKRVVSIWKQLRRNSFDGSELMMRGQLDNRNEDDQRSGHQEEDAEKIWNALKELGISAKQSDINYIREVRKMEVRDIGEKEWREAGTDRNN